MVTVQERIGKFPKAIVVDLHGLACATRYGIVHPGERGYQPLYLRQGEGEKTLAELDQICAEVNHTRLPTEAEREAALFGSMFGWDCPGADPESHMVKVKLEAKEGQV